MALLSVVKAWPQHIYGNDCTQHQMSCDCGYGYMFTVCHNFFKNPYNIVRLITHHRACSTMTIRLPRCILNTVYLCFVCLRDSATGLHKDFKKIFKFVLVCFNMLWVPALSVSSRLQPPSLCFTLQKQKCFMWPCIKLLWLRLSCKYLLLLT